MAGALCRTNMTKCHICERGFEESFRNKKNLFRELLFSGAEVSCSLAINGAFRLRVRLQPRLARAILTYGSHPPSNRKKQGLHCRPCFFLGRKDSNLRNGWTKTSCLTTWRRPIIQFSPHRGLYYIYY